RMSFGDHLEELRLHLWRAIVGFVIAMVLSLFLGRPAMYLLVIQPVEQQLDAFYQNLVAKSAQHAVEEADQGRAQGANDARYVDLQFLRPQLKAVLAGEAVKPIEDPNTAPDEDWVNLPMRIPQPVHYANALLPAQRFLEPPRTLKTFNIMEA